MSDENVQDYRLNRLEEKLDKMEATQQQILDKISDNAINEYRVQQIEKKLEKRDNKWWAVVAVVISTLLNTTMAWLLRGGLSK